MENKKDNPGVYIPPPLFYVVTFIAAVFIQRKFPIDDSSFHLRAIKILGIVFIVISLFFLVRSLRQFLQSKNSLMTIRPAFSLQINGIYNITRNPMYVGLAIVYLGITCFIGNWWNIILFPLLLVCVQEYIIKHEEKYLARRFGQEYLDYKYKVRRWL
jgi:protein-S-isoprenylcysteine O-methyltransferase Ste14